MDGLVLVDKPAGKTSHDLTLAIKRGLGVRRAGHAGTLDPFATGLLLVLVGRARRVQRFFVALPKQYVAVARLGAVSTTGDPEGEITPTGVPVPDRLELPTGRLRQRPPAYSAVRIAGRRAYERARRGEEFAVPEREVTVHRFEELRRDGDRVELLIECSSGTYVRQLVAALGDAYCEQLERTAIGPFELKDADPERLVPLAEALSFLPNHELDEVDARRVAHGVAVAGATTAAATGADVVRGHASVPRAVRLTHGKRILAIAEPREDRLKPLVVFPG
jgi:tRNA pseudouridine55 synthase